MEIPKLKQVEEGNLWFILSFTAKGFNKELSRLNEILDYNDLIDGSKATTIIENLVDQAVKQKAKVISIVLTNKKTLPVPKNTARITFVKNGKSSPLFESYEYSYDKYGKGRIYQSLKEALATNNISKES